MTSNVHMKDSYGELAPCNAPFNNMYFTVHGKVSPCWKLTDHCDQWSHERSIKDIWTGEKFKNYRDALTQNIFMFRCKECEHDINNGSWPLAKAYEEYPLNDFYPSLIELELSNQCNLECVMCNGTLSSGIRKNRDKLPPLPQIYDENFREQLQEFIPHLTELRFNGGEPFAQKIVLDICDDVARINSNLKINIATNGTVYNKRVKHILSNNNIHLNISIDSLDETRYEQIRVNGSFKTLMHNFNIFKEYCSSNNRNLCIMVNPMRNNWFEMVEFGKFAVYHNVKLWYNTILYPKDLALFNLPSDQLRNVYVTLKKQKQSVTVPESTDHFVEYQLKNWLLDTLIHVD